MDVDTDVRRRADRDRAFDPFHEIPPPKRRGHARCLRMVFRVVVV